MSLRYIRPCVRAPGPLPPLLGAPYRTRTPTHNTNTNLPNHHHPPPLLTQPPFYQSLSDSENALLGLAGGGLEVTCFQSLNYFKNATQQGLPLSMDPRVLYRGYGANVANMGGGTMWQVREERTRQHEGLSSNAGRERRVGRDHSHSNRCALFRTMRCFLRPWLIYRTLLSISLLLSLSVFLSLSHIPSL